MPRLSPAKAGAAKIADSEAKAAALAETRNNPEDQEKALLHWAKAAELYLKSGQAQSDAAFAARARKASLARHFLRLGRFDVLARTWGALGISVSRN